MYLCDTSSLQHCTHCSEKIRDIQIVLSSFDNSQFAVSRCAESSGEFAGGGAIGAIAPARDSLGAGSPPPIVQAKFSTPYAR